MDKPNDIIIRYTIYGFLIGIIFRFASLPLHSLTVNISFTLHGFGYLHKLFAYQFLPDVIPVLTTMECNRFVMMLANHAVLNVTVDQGSWILCINLVAQKF